MSPAERESRDAAAECRRKAALYQGAGNISGEIWCDVGADLYDLNADLQALCDGLSLAEVESLRRLCRGEG